MFDHLRAEIERLPPLLDARSLVEAFAVRDLLDARLTVAVGEFEAAGRHELDGAVTMSSWLRHRTVRDDATARRLAIHGRKLRSLPVLREAALDGTVSDGQLEIVLAHVRLGHLERFAAHEAELVPLLAPLPIDQLHHAMGSWRAKAEALDDDGPGPAHDNEARLVTTIDGRGDLRASVDADLKAALDAGFRAADAGDRDRTLAQRRGEALGTIFQFFLDHQDVTLGCRHRPHLNVVMTYDEWTNGELDRARYLDTGQLVSPAQLGVFLCDATFHRLVTSGTSAVLDYGRGTRFWPADLYNAIAVRDQGCRFPGCDRPASWCDVHHVQEWDADAGPTSINNGVLLCRRHHRLLHSKRGFVAKLLPDATFEVTFPDGHTEATRPPGTGRGPPDYRS